MCSMALMQHAPCKVTSTDNNQVNVVELKHSICLQTVL